MKIIHFCFGMTPDFGGRPFGLSHYLAVRSAWEVLRPDVMFMHCAHEPSGDWWDLARPLLKVHRVHPIAGIYGFPAAHPAHRADIIRLAALIAMGGIYLDTDVLALKSFDELLTAPFAAAIESGADGTPVGISNAVLAAEPSSRFARLCLDGHNPARSLWGGFRSQGRDEYYIEYSVHYPCLLGQLCPQLIRVLPSQTFLWAGWNDAGLRMLFEQDATVPDDALALHLWESHSWKRYLSQLSVEDIAGQNTTFNRLARRFLPQVPPTPGNRNLPDDRFQAGLDEMDRICKEADFVSEKYLPATTLAGRFKRKLRTLVGSGRSELLPTRSQVEALEQRVKQMEQRGGVPQLDVEKLTSAGQRSSPLIRCGSGDGSEILVERSLRDLEITQPLSYIIATGEGAEPAVVNWLPIQPEASGVWISASLPRAKTLSEWSVQTGRLCNVFHSTTSSQEWSTLLENSAIPADPTLLVLAGTGREYWRWEAAKNLKPSLVLVTCNPVLPSDSTLAVSSEQPGHASGLIWSASRGAFLHLAATRGYSLQATSADGLFLLFAHGVSKESSAEKEVLPRKMESVPVRTTGGQIIQISIDGALKILAEARLINVTNGQSAGLNADGIVT